MVRSGKSPCLTLKEVYELGFDYAISPIEQMLAMHKAVKETMDAFMRAGCSTDGSPSGYAVRGVHRLHRPAGHGGARQTHGA